jgi:hypothetical protein
MRNIYGNIVLTIWGGDRENLAGQMWYAGVLFTLNRYIFNKTTPEINKINKSGE